jgi:cell division protein FtsB
MSISPNVPSPEESYRYESTGTPRWIAVLFFVLFIVLAAFGYVGYSGITRLEQNLAKEQDQSKVLTAQLEQANSRLADLKGHIEVTEQKMGMTVSELAQAKSRAESIRKKISKPRKLISKPPRESSSAPPATWES